MYDDKSIFLTFPENTKLEDALFKFLKEINSEISLSRDKISFLSGCKILNAPENLQKNLFHIFKPKINNPIRVVKTGNVIGGGGLDGSIYFTDVSKNITKTLRFSKNAPSYRGVEKGINIFGICINYLCLANNKEVVVPIKKKFFDLIEEKYDLKCPECSNIIIPKTCGFSRCEYKISGKIYENENDKIKKFSIEEKADDPNGIKYYNPDENGNAKMIELKFEVLKYI